MTRMTMIRMMTIIMATSRNDEGSSYLLMYSVYSSGV